MLDRRFVPFVFVALTTGFPWPSGAENRWPWFRGPEGTGVAPGANPPIAWSENENVVWQVELDGLGHSSPIVWGDRIYVMSAREGAPATQAAPAAAESADESGAGDPDEGGLRPHEFAVSAHDFASGSPLWRTVVREAVPHESLHPTASQASGSPVTDGTHLWAFFGSRGLYCLDLEGDVKWQVDLGVQTTRNAFGEGASPVVHGDLVIVNWDHEGQSFLVALEKLTGEQRWRRDRDEPTSWSSPLVVRDGERDVVVVSASTAVRGYDLETGDALWSVGGLGLNVVSTPVADERTVWAMSGWREARGMAIRYPGARGDLTGSDRVAWEIDQGLSYVPSAVLAAGRIYFFQRFTGILSCYDLSSGQPCYDRQRIDGFDNVYASPVAAGERIYAVSRSGETVVFAAGPSFEILGRNQLDDVFSATPAIAGDSLILRGDRYLYRIGVEVR